MQKWKGSVPSFSETNLMPGSEMSVNFLIPRQLFLECVMFLERLFEAFYLLLSSVTFW